MSPGTGQAAEAPSGAESGKGSRWARVLISGFIAFHALAVLSGSYEQEWRPNWLNRFTHPYLTQFGLAQRWALFSPEPRRYIDRFRVEIYPKNAKKIVWSRPYPPNWDFFARHLSYNFQKWDLAGHYLEYPGLLWEDLTQYVLQLYHDDQHPAEFVKLILTKTPVPPPKETGYVGPFPSELIPSDEVIYMYDVKQGKFL